MNTIRAGTTDQEWREEMERKGQAGGHTRKQGFKIKQEGSQERIKQKLK